MPWMDKMVASLSKGLVAYVLLMGGCDRSDEGASYVQDCRAFCDRLESCDNRTDREACVDGCADQEFWSTAYVQSRARCAQELSCNLWQDDVDNQGQDQCAGTCELRACVERELLLFESAPEREQACSAMATKLVACVKSGEVQSLRNECLKVSKLLSAPYFEASRQCVDMECSEIALCLDELATAYEAEVRLFEGAI